jgi:hypothetical protein
LYREEKVKYRQKETEQIYRGSKSERKGKLSRREGYEHTKKEREKLRE